MLAVDTETTGFGWYDDAFLVSIADDNGSQVVDLTNPSDRAAGWLCRRLEEEKLVFHNAKFDLQKLIRAGLVRRETLSPGRIEDTDGLAHLLNPHGNKKLKYLAKTVLGLETDEATAIAEAKKELQKQHKKDTGTMLYSKDIDYSMLPREVIIPYALKDAEYTWELWKVLKPQVKDGLLDLYNREMELTLVMLDIEANGMCMNMEYVDREIKNLNGKILSCELRIADMTSLRVWYPERSGQKVPEGCFNPNSEQQIRAQFGGRDIELENTQKATLAALKDPLAENLVELREYKKLLTTYLLNMKNDQRDGIIHPSYKLHQAKTGRMSSGASQGD